MRLLRRIAWVFTLALALLTACNPEGRVGLRFAFSDLPADLTGLFFHVQIRDADGDVLSGSVTAASANARFALSVPHGDDRVAVVELRDSASPTASNVIAYGVSQPFSIRPGDDRTIEARVAMRRVPAIVTLVAPDTVNDGQVPITVTADRDGLAQIVLAQDPSLTFGRRVYDAVPGVAQTITYDIDAACRAAGSCTDGRRNVFARLFDEAGYSSTATSTPVVVDTRPPTVLIGSGSVSMRAPGDLLIPTTAGTGVTVRLSFVFDEPVTSTPSVTLEGSGLEFEPVTTELGAYVFERVVLASDPTGLQRPLVRARDRAGNEAPVPARDLEYVVDRTPPAAPDVDTPDTIVYRREPYGDEAAGGASFSVVGAPGAVEGGARVVVYDRARPFANGVEIANRAGAANAEADGSFLVELAPVDLEDVYLLVLDSSGNFHDPEGRAVRVRDVEWRVPAGVATGARPPVDVFTVDRMVSNTRLDRAGVVAIDGAPLGSQGGATIDAHYDLRWTEHLPVASAVPDALRFAGATHDVARGRVVLFGGRSAGNLVRGATWEWDGSRWQLLPTSIVQPRCEDGSIPGDDPFGYFTYHGALGLSVLVCRFLSPRQAPPLPAGGTDELRAFGWDGVAWRTVALEGAAPSGRVGHAITYDSSRGRAVLFGGNEGSLAFVGASDTTIGDTWELEAVPTSSVGTDATLRWIERTPTGPTPPVRDRHAMVYAPSLGGVVMFGGISGAQDRHALDDLWLWDGASWTEIPRTGAWPPARALHAMAYDPERGAVGVIGGVASEPSSDDVDLVGLGLDDAWWWDGATWTQTATAADTPRGPGLAATTDWARGDVVVPSSVVPNAAAAPSRTFVVTARHWDDRTPSNLIPPDSDLEAAAYDPGRDVTWLHATRWVSGAPNIMTSETWQWTDSGWRFITLDPRIAATYDGTFDVAREEFFLLAWLPESFLTVGFFAHDGARWLETATGTVGPRSFSLSAAGILFYDPVRDRPICFAFGGSEFGPGNTVHELYELGPDRDRWTLIHSAPLPHPNVQGATLAFEPRSGGYFLQYLHATSQTFRTMTFDGSGWTDRSGSEGAWTSLRGVVSDAGRELVLTLGGIGGTARLWEWRGSYVERATVGPAPSRQIGNSIAYDTRRHRVIVNETAVSLSAPAGAVYTLDVDPEARPAVAARVRLQASGVAPATLRSIRIEADAGGGGYAGPDTPRTDGAELIAYSPRAGAWLPLATNAADEAQPSSIARTLEAEEARAFTRADSAELLLAIQSAEGLGGGPDAPVVRVDRLVVVVRYRR